MSDRQPTIIVQQSQSQSGCCAGAGCGWVIAAALLLLALGALLSALGGDYGLGWQIGAWTGTVVVVLLIIAGGVAWADQKFGWGLTDPPDATPQAHTKAPEDVLGEDDENYGTATPGAFGGIDTRTRGSDTQPAPDAPGGETAQEPEGAYTVVLSEAGPSKIRVIKEVRARTGMGLREAKDLVDGAPNIVAESLSEREAQTLKARLEEAGAMVELW